MADKINKSLENPFYVAMKKDLDIQLVKECV
jgi:hypothetical protein